MYIQTRSQKATSVPLLTYKSIMCLVMLQKQEEVSFTIPPKTPRTLILVFVRFNISHSLALLEFNKRAR